MTPPRRLGNGDRCITGGCMCAARVSSPVVRYFKTAEGLNRDRKHKWGDKGGSDGTRTRDLRRDRQREGSNDPPPEGTRDHD
jgi:hypothetical protein